MRETTNISRYDTILNMNIKTIIQDLVLKIKNLTTSQQIQIQKTVTWTIISTSITFVVVYAFTGSWEWGASISLTERVFKIFAYYPHERYWHRKYKALKKSLKKAAK